MKYRLLPIALLVVMILSACQTYSMPTLPPTAVPVPTATSDPSAPTAMPVSADLPAWYKIPFINVANEQEIKIEDFLGKVIMFEPMAGWCGTCFAQQTIVKQLHDKMGMRDDFMSISLDVDLNTRSSAVKQYAELSGFDWTFGQTNADLSRELSALYGDQFINPPSAPMLIIDKQGEAHLLPFGGVRQLDELEKILEPYLQ